MSALALTGRLATIAAPQGAAAHAAAVDVLTSVALTSALDELAPQFEGATGNKVTIGYNLMADIKNAFSRVRAQRL